MAPGGCPHPGARGGVRPSPFSILPYPAELEEPATLHDGSAIILRPIRPEDLPAHTELMNRMTPQDLRLRFFGQVRQIHHHQMARLTQIDYEREWPSSHPPSKEGQPETLGVVRTITDPDNRRAELAVLVRSDMKGPGLGSMLMDKIVRYQRIRGTAAIYAQIMIENDAMIRLAAKAGFRKQRSDDDPDVVEMVLELDRSNGDFPLCFRCQASFSADGSAAGRQRWSGAPLHDGGEQGQPPPVLVAIDRPADDGVADDPATTMMASWWWCGHAGAMPPPAAPRSPVPPPD
jgi:RimJ/RimL family protein N-acetyltransferase